ncbi:MAG: GNAT family N-acetyltransferase [Gemmatimonadaceae bacterium]
MNISIVRVRASEAAHLSAFASECFDNTYGPLCRAADVDAYIAQSLSPSALLPVLTDPTSWVFAAIIDDVWVGYAHVHLASLPAGMVNTHESAPSITPMEVSRFYVSRKWIGKGVSQQLLRTIITHAKSHGAETLWLSVWQENGRATSFYAKSGFSIIGTSTFLMGEDLQHDYIMQRVISRMTQEEAEQRNADPTEFARSSSVRNDSGPRDATHDNYKLN